MHIVPVPKVKFANVLILFLATTRSFVLPAFPGADGAGANALGGRGGTVFHVTTTNDNGSSSLAGSLRQGVSVANRTISSTFRARSISPPI